jgi:alpha-beta hydrolase superfamily lysophospholipase
MPSQELVSAGLEVVAFDYRGFGDSQGWPNEENFVADAKAMWGFVTSRRAGALGIPPERVSQ